VLEDEIFGVEVSQIMIVLFLNHLLENADILGLGDLDSKDLC